MKYRSLGRTGVQVSAQTLGTMMFGAWGNTDHEECARIVHAALDAGINLVDTADVYSGGESEEIVGKALKGRRDDVVLATKVHGQMGEGRNRSGNSRRWIVQEVENSLRRLQTDRIDLYQIHRPDPTTDVEETLSALTDLVHTGKILAFGSSTYPAHEIVKAQWVAQSRGLGRFVTEQPPYSILVRGIERDVLPVAAEFDLGVLPWSPLAGGWLSGKYRQGQSQPPSTRSDRIPIMYDMQRADNQAKLRAADALAQLAENTDLTLIQLALAFTQAHPAVTSTIIGPRTMDQLESQLAAADVELAADVLERIDEIVPPGTTLAERDRGYAPPALVDPALRRRAVRAAA